MDDPGPRVRYTSHMGGPGQRARPARVVILVALIVCALSARTGTQTSTPTPDARPYFQYTSVFPPGSPDRYDGAANIALFDDIRDVVISPAGVMFVADGHAVRRVAADGAVTTIAGVVTEAGDLDGVGTLARFRDPAAIAVDSAGVVFVADTGNHTIRRIALDGTVTTVAGRAGLSGSANGEGRLARLFNPNGIIVHPSGAVYFTEQNCLVRRLTTALVVELVSGAPGVCAHVDGTAAIARLTGPVAIAVDAAGVMYVAQNNHTLRRVTADGVVTTLAGTPGWYGTQDGSASEGRLSFPQDVTVTPSGAVRVLEAMSVESSGGSHSMNVGQTAIRDVAPDGTLTRVRYLVPNQNWTSPGRGLAYDAAGRAYWARADPWGPAYELLVAQGSDDIAAVKVGSGAGPQYRADSYVATDADGIVELIRIAGDGWRVRRVSFDGTAITTLASLPDVAPAGELQRIIAANGGTIIVVRRHVVSPDGKSTLQRVADGTSQTFAIVPAAVLGMAPGPNGGFIALAAHTVFEVSSAGVVRTIAGDGQQGYADGPAASARFDRPLGAVVAPDGDVFIADTRNHVIRRISAAGQVTTIAGAPGAAGWVDGAATAARFDLPTGLALMTDGSLIVRDQTGRAMRRVLPSGEVSSIALPSRSLKSTSSTLSPSMTGTNDGRVVWAHGRALWIGAVATPAVLSITQPPTAQSVQTGDDAAFFLVASGAPVAVVEWQESLDGGGTWSRVSPPAGPIGNRYTLVLRAVNAAMHGRQYRALVTDADEVIVSTPVTLSVSGLGANVSSLSFLATAQSSGAFSAAPQSVSITVPVAGTSWTVVSDQSWLTVSPSSGTDAATLSVSVNAAAMTDGQSVFGSLRVTAASLEPVVIPVHMKALRVPAFVMQPRDFPLRESSFWFSTRVAGLEYTLRWEQSEDGVSWTPGVGTAGFSSLREWWLTGPAPTEDRWYRAVATNAAGSTISTHVRAMRPSMAADRPAIDFRGWRDSSGMLHFINLTSQVQLSEVSWWTTGWSLTSPVPWLVITPASGSGAGTLTFTLRPEFLPSGTEWSVATTVLAQMISTGALDNLPVATVAVRVTAPADSAGPFGQVDTPVQNAAGVVGAIGVTGWALDDVGVSGVQVFRTCLPYEEGPGSDCQTIMSGTPQQARVVLVGDAAFLAGARPDVAAAFSAVPQANRAGWGMLVLTPMLPDVGRSVDSGGVGPLTLYVVATDVEGHQVMLGRSSDPASAELRTPTSITMANDTLAKPFGSIDTPALGETVSGVIPNFGWALTPDTNTTGGDPGDVLIPTNGSTMWVFVDDVPVGNVVYNQCRVTPFNSGTFCLDDVSNIFGNPTPQPLGQARTENVTRFRNLDMGRAPIGAYVLDTTTLINGLHTIAWSVTDSLGRTEGIGSRFFTVFNSGADHFGGAEARALRGGIGGAEALALRGGIGGAEALALHGGGGGDLRRAWALAPPYGLWGRTGFDLSASWLDMHPRANGRYQVRLPEMGRLELWFGAAVEAGYLVAPDGSLQDLPVGSSLSGARFGWAAPVGYHGPYHLVFVRDGERIDVDVTVAPLARAEGDTEAEIRMHLDGVLGAGCAVRSAGPGAACQVRIEGWAYDPRAAIEGGIGAVHIWARPRVQDAGFRVQGSAPIFVGEATLNVARPDVAKAHADAPAQAGFSLSATLAPGTYEFTAYVWNVRTARWEDARTVIGTVR